MHRNIKSVALFFNTFKTEQESFSGSGLGKSSPLIQNYSVSEQECLKLIYSITKYRLYLIGEDFDLHTGHNCLRWLL